MAESLPADLIFKILLQLPVKTLLRVRHVCKGWRDIIDGHDFAKSHSNTQPSLLMLHHLWDEDRSYDVVDLSSFRSGARSPLAFKHLPVRECMIHYVGNCNGLVCMSERTGILLWNPATGKQFRFGFPPPERSWKRGFGYDKDSDDYKVVAFECTVTDDYGKNFTWIYSLRSRSWSCIGEFPYKIIARYCSSGVFVSGALHYIVAHPETKDDLIGAIHLGKLEYNAIPLPDYDSVSTNMIGPLAELNGHLCVAYSVPREYDLWMMKEYGVKESWTKLVRLRAEYDSKIMIPPSTYFKDKGVLFLGATYDCEVVVPPLTYFEDEEVLLFNGGCLCSEYYKGARRSTVNKYSEIVGYNLKTGSFEGAHEFEKRIEELEGEGRSYEKLENERLSFVSYVYVPTLVSPLNIYQV